jgi:hypothetical protein
MTLSAKQGHATGFAVLAVDRGGTAERGGVDGAGAARRAQRFFVQKILCALGAFVVIFLLPTPPGGWRIDTNCLLIAAYNKYSLDPNARPHSHHPVRPPHPPTPPSPKPLPGTTSRTNRLPPHLHRHGRTGNNNANRYRPVGVQSFEVF